MSGADQWNGPTSTTPTVLMRRLADQLPRHLTLSRPVPGDRFRMECLSCPTGEQYYVAPFGEDIRTAREALRILRDDFAMMHMHGSPIPAHWIGGNVPPANDPFAAEAGPGIAEYQEPWLQSRDRDAMVQNGADKRAALAAAVTWAGKQEQFTEVLELAGQCLDWLRYCDYPLKYVRRTDDDAQS